MKTFLTLALLSVLASCSHQVRHPASALQGDIAQDSIALGNVQALATKQFEQNSVCFQIELKLTGGSQAQAAPGNWTLAWVDQQGQQHPVSLQQRDPASTPAGGPVISSYGQYEQWSNTFRTCAPATLAQVKGLVLTPKQLDYSFKDGLQLSWK